MKIFDIPLETRKYDQIEAGLIREYHESREYWIERLMERRYTHVRFRRGASAKSMLFELPEYGPADDKSLPGVWRLGLGQRIGR